MGFFSVKTDRKQKRNFVPDFTITKTVCGRYKLSFGVFSFITNEDFGFEGDPDLFDTELDALEMVYRIAADNHYKHILKGRAVIYE